MKRFVFLLALLLWFGLNLLPAHAQDAITVTQNRFANNFPQDLSFTLQAQSSAKITRVELIAQVNGQNSRRTYSPDFSSDTKIDAKYQWRLPQNYMPPGTSGQYWWNIQDSANNQVSTPKQPFRVEDAKFPWQKLNNDKLALFWYGRDTNFGKAMFDRGNQAMDFLEKYTGVSVDYQVQVYIYHERNAFTAALNPNTVTGWEGGVTMPEFGVVLIDEESYDWTLTTVAHELTHVVVHQKLSGPWGDISMPHWMDEGMAVYFQNTPGTPDPQFSTPLKRAIQSDTLLPVRSLNSEFSAQSVELAYGESWSVVDFIIRHYGKEKLAQLLQEFKTGGFYDDVFRNVLGVDTDGLEVAWRQDIGAKPRVIPTRSISQATALPTFSLSTDYTPVPSTGSVSATATRPPVAVNATPIPAPTSAPSSKPDQSSPANPLGNLCGGVFGLVALGIFGAAAWQRRRE